MPLSPHTRSFARNLPRPLFLGAAVASTPDKYQVFAPRAFLQPDSIGTNVSHCHNLEKVKYDEVGGSSRAWPDYEAHIVSNCVRSLAIHSANQMEVDDVLCHSTLPELTSLTISGVGLSIGEWVWDNTVLKDFSDLRSSFRLTHLHLRHLPITDPGIIPALRTPLFDVPGRTRTPQSSYEQDSD
ncbi:hypothetical protein PM082_007897 [Marasmius tenuissimus]|nr:hypothetical protein PM082_007897 [Marasmius tenuissimus]